MPDIPEDRKQQIRAEEEARALQRKEEKYREEVRRELEASRSNAPAVAPAPRKRGRGGSIGLLILGLATVITGVVFIIVGLRASRDDGGPELAAPGGGALTPKNTPWKPAELSYEDLKVGGGKVETVPDPGITRLADLARQPPPAAGGTTKSTPAAATSSFDAVVDYVPPETFAMVAIDLEQAKRSPAVGSLVSAMLAQTGRETSVAAAVRAGGLTALADARLLVIGAIPAGPRKEPWPLIVIAGPIDPARVETGLIASGGSAGARDAEGVTIALPGGAVLIRRDLLVIGPANVIERALAAKAGDSAAETGELREAIKAARGGAGFVAVRMIDDLRDVARNALPALATATWLAGTLELGSGPAGVITMTGTLAVPDDATAAQIAAAIELGKTFGANELRAKDPIAARALDKISASGAGAFTRATATFDDVEALALIFAVTR